MGDQAMTFWGPVELAVSTDRPHQLVDLTERVSSIVADHPLAAGSVQAFCPHTSCGLAITELEDGLHRDIEAVMEELASTTRGYVHDDLQTRTQNIEPDVPVGDELSGRASFNNQDAGIHVIGGRSSAAELRSDRERENGWSHIRALLMTQPSVVLPVQGGSMALGTWQRLFLVELDGPRPARKIHIQGWGVTGV